MWVFESLWQFSFFRTCQSGSICKGYSGFKWKYVWKYASRSYISSNLLYYRLSLTYDTFSIVLLLFFFSISCHQEWIFKKLNCKRTSLKYGRIIVSYNEMLGTDHVCNHTSLVPIKFSVVWISVQTKKMFILTDTNKYSAHPLIGSRIIESVAYCNQKLLALSYPNSTQNTSVNCIIRLLLSLFADPKWFYWAAGTVV